VRATSNPALAGGGHRMAHLAEPDDTDAAHDALAHISTFLRL
jgi:hypothetical protein